MFRPSVVIAGNLQELSAYPCKTVDFVAYIGKEFPNVFRFISGFCSIESDNSFIEASGVRNSCEASDTNACASPRFLNELCLIRSVRFRAARIHLPFISILLS